MDLRSLLNPKESESSNDNWKSMKHEHEDTSRSLVPIERGPQFLEEYARTVYQRKEDRDSSEETASICSSTRSQFTSASRTPPSLAESKLASLRYLPQPLFTNADVGGQHRRSITDSLQIPINGSRLTPPLSQSSSFSARRHDHPIQHQQQQQQQHHRPTFRRVVKRSPDHRPAYSAEQCYYIYCLYVLKLAWKDIEDRYNVKFPVKAECDPNCTHNCNELCRDVDGQCTHNCKRTQGGLQCKFYRHCEYLGLPKVRDYPRGLRPPRLDAVKPDVWYDWMVEFGMVRPDLRGRQLPAIPPRRMEDVRMTQVPISSLDSKL